MPAAPLMGRQSEFHDGLHFLFILRVQGVLSPAAVRAGQSKLCVADSFFMGLSCAFAFDLARYAIGIVVEIDVLTGLERLA